MAEKTTSYPFEKRIYSLLNYKGLFFLNLTAFLLGRAGILGELTPFGIGFFTALCCKNKKYISTALSTYLGILTVQGFAGAIPYGLSLALIAVTFQYLFNTRKIKTLTAALTGAGIYLVSVSFFTVFDQFYVYDLFMNVFEALVIFVSVYIASYAIPIALNQNRRKVLATEEIICVAILMALTLSGVKELEVMGVSLKNILGILITILFAYNGGPGVGASIGVTLGLITSMSAATVPPIIIGIFAFSGLLAGIFKDMGKIGSALGFLIGNVILTFYINGYYEVFIQIKEVIGAFIIFLLIPNPWLDQLQKYSSPVLGIIHSTKNYGEEIQLRIYDRLKDFSNTFIDLSSTFENMTRQIEQFGQRDLSLLLDKLAISVCSDCGMKRSCWENNFLNTYQGLQELLLLIETKGEVNEQSLPDQIQKRCIRTRAVTEKMMTLYELSRLNMVWKKRLLESKELVGEQLKGVANGILHLAEELNSEIIFDTELEDAVYVELDKAGLSVKKLLVSTNEGGKMEIQVQKRSCYGNGDCTERYVDVISKAVGLEFACKNRKCNTHDACQFTLVEAKQFTAVTKVARVTKEGNIHSGDSFTFSDLNHDGFMIALSDGMGTGDKAYRQSSATISMLEKMMEAGFGKEMSIKTINSLLMLKSTEEIFSTIDMAVIDLHNGRAEFSKIGSAPSFIKRQGGKVEIVNSASLPMGILTDIEVHENSVQLKDGDFIIMVSDGILEANEEQGEEWLVNHLMATKTRNPQELADKILHEALSYTPNGPKDDMTVLVTKLWGTRSH